MYVCIRLCVRVLMAVWVIGVVISWRLKGLSTIGLLPLSCHPRTSGMTCNFLTITFKMDSNFAGLGLTGRAGVTALVTDPKGCCLES